MSDGAAVAMAKFNLRIRWGGRRRRRRRNTFLNVRWSGRTDVEIVEGVSSGFSRAQFHPVGYGSIQAVSIGSKFTFAICFSKLYMIPTDPVLIKTLFLMMEVLSRPRASQPYNLVFVKQDEGDRHQQSCDYPQRRRRPLVVKLVAHLRREQWQSSSHNVADQIQACERRS